MKASDLLCSMIELINNEIEILLDVPENEALAGNIYQNELTIDNYLDTSTQYINIVDKLLSGHVNIKFFLKKILYIVSKIDKIDEDIDICESFKYCAFSKDLLANLYYKNDEIKNIFLFSNKIGIISTSETDFTYFIDNLNVNKIDTLLYLGKLFYDNFSFTKTDDKDRIIFLPNCAEEQINTFTNNNNELVSYIKLSILSEGESFHKHFNLDNSLNTNLVCDTTKKYSEFNEIFYILSEYNKSKDLLNKFFLLYTVIENFMYRQPIAKMINNTNEFNIRDFKFFYNQINTRELDKLTELFKEIKKESYNSSFATINVLIEKEINTFKSNNSADFLRLNDLFKKINVTLDNNILNANSLKNLILTRFHVIIYNLRNTILHNTETEYHLTHFKLSKSPYISKFIQDLIIPLLEKIILHLIISNSAIIKYNQKELILYK